MTILDEILAHKREELTAARAVRAPDELADRARGVAEPTRGFRRALVEAPPPRIVAEIKRRSPSRGEIRADFDPGACAKAYADGGAAALSVLTDAHYFGGSLEYLELARRSASLPVLRKDFVIDPYQIDEARLAGADAVLLIVTALERDELVALRDHATEHGIDTLVEVKNEAELEVALGAGADLVGINNRDLRSFEVDLGVTERLAPGIPEGVVVVAESGIFTPEDLTRLEAAGSHAFLVGESLMREADIGRALRELRRTS